MFWYSPENPKVPPLVHSVFGLRHDCEARGLHAVWWSNIFWLWLTSASCEMLESKKPFKTLLKDIWVRGGKQGSITSRMKETKRQASLDGDCWLCKQQTSTQPPVTYNKEKSGNSLGKGGVGNRTWTLGIGSLDPGKDTKAFHLFLVTALTMRCQIYPHPAPLLYFPDSNGSLTSLARFSQFASTLITGTLWSGI